MEDVQIQDKLTIITRNKDGIRERTLVEYLFIAVGREPALDFIDNDLDINLIQNEGRLYLIGNVKNGIYRQVGITVGAGIKVAIEVSTKTGER